MFTDSRDHTITTTSREAAEHCDRAISYFCARRADASSTLGLAIKADEECVLGQSLMGLMLCGLRKNSVMPLAKSAHSKACEHRASATQREQLYIDALQIAIDRQPDKLLACYETILDKYPRDLLALALAQGEAFWSGDMTRSEYVSRSTVSGWDSSIEGYGDWLAIRAFDLEETGELTAAEALGRQAIDLDPGNTWAAHAVAHVLEMRGESKAGVIWLDSLKDRWSNANQLKFHLWWHRCLCHVERKEYDAVLEIYDTWIRNSNNPLMEALPDFYLDIQNAASILMRMELLGVPVGSRWQELSSAIESVYLDITSPFTSIHSAMSFAATGEFEKLDMMLSEIEHFASTQGKLAHAYSLTIPVIKGIKAHRLSQHSEVLEQMVPARYTFEELGGSHAQRDILFQIMFDSAKQLKQSDLITSLHQDLEKIGFTEPSKRIAYQA